jgi:hypothetical protein
LVKILPRVQAKVPRKLPNKTYTTDFFLLPTFSVGVLFGRSGAIKSGNNFRAGRSACCTAHCNAYIHQARLVISMSAPPHQHAAGALETHAANRYPHGICNEPGYGMSTEAATKSSQHNT